MIHFGWAVKEDCFPASEGVDNNSSWTANNVCILPCIVWGLCCSGRLPISCVNDNEPNESRWTVLKTSQQANSCNLLCPRPKYPSCADERQPIRATGHRLFRLHIVWWLGKRAGPKPSNLAERAWPCLQTSGKSFCRLLTNVGIGGFSWAKVVALVSIFGRRRAFTMAFAGWWLSP